MSAMKASHLLLIFLTFFGHAYSNLEPAHRRYEPGAPPLSLAVSSGNLALLKSLINSGEVLDELDWLGQTALHMAAKFQRTDAARILLEKGANCCIANLEYEETPLHLAAKTGSTEIMKMLLDLGADVNSEISPYVVPGGTPLAYAGLYNPYSWKTAAILLQKGAKVNLRNSYDQSVLQLYAKAGNFRVVRKLVEKYNVDVDSPNRAGCTTIFFMAQDLSDGYYWAVFDYLLSKGARVNSTCWKSHKTPLHGAVYSANAAFVRSLISYGADVNSLDAYERSPLLFAVLFAPEVSEEVVKILLHNGADVNQRTPSSGKVKLQKPCNTILSAAIHRLKLDPSAIPKRVIDLLVKYGAGLHVKCEHEAIWLAKWRHRQPNEPPPRIQPYENGRNLPDLLKASIMSDTESVGAILNVGNNSAMEAADAFGRTPLHWAVAAENVYLTGLLIQAGANVDAVDYYGRRPLDVAASTGNAEIMQLLMWKGAELKLAADRAVYSAIVDANSADALDFLIKMGVDFGPEPYHFLHLAANKQNVRNIERLVDAGFSINAKSEYEQGRTPLAHLVQSDCCYPQLGALQVLLEQGADINARDDDGLSPLALSISTRRRKQVVLYLIRNGADVNSKDVQGCNAPLYMLIKKATLPSHRYHMHAIDGTGDPDDEERDVAEIAKEMVSAEADYQHIDACDGKSALDLAKEKGLYKVIEALS